jgi:molybdopterin molybdotransferase
VAAALTFAILARPLILRLCGAATAPPLTFPVQAGFAYRKKAGRREYLRASIERDGSAAIARRFPRDGAGILSSIVQSDGFAILDETVTELTPGAILEFLPFSEVFG